MGVAAATAPGLLSATPARAASAPALATPTGRWPIATTVRHVVDPVRIDPFTKRRREIMVQFWYPTRRPGGPCAAYVSRSVSDRLDQGLGVSLPGRFCRIRTHSTGDAPRAGTFPIVLYSHGSGSYRASATALCEDLASHGYLVVALDHTFDSVAVRFPHGRIVGMGDPKIPGWTEEQLPDKLDELRSGDLRLVVDLLRDPRCPIGAFGHSRGGSAVSAAMGVDSRIVAGLGIDSSIATSVATNGLPHPFMLLTEAGDFAPEDGPFGTHWKLFQAHHRGWGRHLDLAGSGHWTFMDPAPLLDFLGTPDILTASQIDSLFGTAAIRSRAVPITRAYVRAFFDRHLKGWSSPLLNRPSSQYPEISFRWRQN
ncbi:alpha/beta hydrolase family protein [Fodinicola acaciae]|uniref:alpha/beta hydrolase family protein n=1 Tax=Fodinicola acaciae TaxID=2681555 RepID=UPI0013D017A3|nr:alpha/beta hydrolase [Fodinicola acaciae]